jgi:hypothetical protein
MFEKKFAKKVRKYYKLLEGREGGEGGELSFQCLRPSTWPQAAGKKLIFIYTYIQYSIGLKGKDKTLYYLDCRYLNLLCDNLKKRKFLQNFFPDTILGICYVFPVILHIIQLFYSQTISLLFAYMATGCW